MKEGFTFTCLYDFGDYRQHTVEVERILEKENDKVYPVYAEGQLVCPPEDSGGIHGFYEKFRNINRQSRYEYILHLVNHGSYHRGQIVAICRMLGVSAEGP